MAQLLPLVFNVIEVMAALFSHMPVEIPRYAAVALFSCAEKPVKTFPTVVLAYELMYISLLENVLVTAASVPSTELVQKIAVPLFARAAVRVVPSLVPLVKEYAAAVPLNVRYMLPAVAAALLFNDMRKTKSV